MRAYPDLMQYIDPLCGVATPYGNLFPPGSRVAAYLRSVPREGDDAIKGKLVSTLAAALARCKSGYGDIILVLPGHSENVGATGLAGLVPGTTIVGLGNTDDDYAPTFTWNDAGSNWAVDDKNVTIAGLRLVAGGADGVTTAITWSAAGGRFVGNRIIAATSAALECTTVLSVAAGASSLRVSRNKSRGAVGVTTSVIALAGAADDVEIDNNDLQMLGSAAATGVIAIAAAATNLRIHHNTLENSKSDSTAAISAANVASTGKISDNDLIIFTNGVAAATGLVFTSTGSLIRCFRNYCCDEPRASGVLSPVACAT